MLLNSLFWQLSRILVSSASCFISFGIYYHPNFPPCDSFTYVKKTADIDKTYNKPQPLNVKLNNPTLPDQQLSASDSEFLSTSAGIQPTLPDLSNALNSRFRRDLIVFKNFDLLRSADLFVVLIIFYATVATL